MEKKKKILLLENSVFLLEVYLSALANANFEVVKAQSAEECLNLAHEGADLIIIDIMDPGINMSGILKELKGNSLTKDIPVIILATGEQEKIITEVLKLGAQGFLLKEHLTPSDLVTRIEEFLPSPILNTEQKNVELS
jgi:two-component system, OmpR family, phosphate regulon response regulator PhoB